MSEKALFKYYNPKAFKEMRGIVTEKEFINNSLEAIDIDNSGIGLFKCSDKSHYYLQFIRKRGLKVYDKNCPFCYMELKTSNLKIINQTIKSIKMHNHIATQFVCYKCKSTWIKYKNDIHYDIKNHLLICDERSKNITSLEISHPEIAKEYSNDNCFSIEILSYDGWRDSQILLNWICSKCNNKYQLTLYDKAEKSENACPYCNGKLPYPENSLKFNYPIIAEEWDKRNPHIPIRSEQISINNELTGNRFKNRSIELKGFFSCKSCKIIYPRKISEIINQCECDLCISGANSINTKLVFSEMNVKDENCFILNSDNEVCSFNCSKCGKKYNANLKDRLLNKYICPICDGRVVAPGINSFKKFNPDLMKEWDQINNYLIIDADMISSINNTYSIYWKCPNNHLYKMTPKSRIMYKKRNQSACPICKGFRQPKPHYF